MEAHKPLLVLAALSLVIVALPSAMSTHHFTAPTGETQADVGNEPNQGTTDTNDLEPAGFQDTTQQAGNGLSANSRSPGSWDLILHAYYQPAAPFFWEANPGVKPQKVLDDFQAAPDAGPFMYPGVQTHDAFFGWWSDKGTGGYLQEVDAPGASTTPDETIDDGDDNHTDDEVFRPTAPSNYTEFDETGQWDEFIWKGPNGNLARDEVLHAPAGQDVGGPRDPAIQNAPGDDMFGFIEPGTHPSAFANLIGKEDSSWTAPVIDPLPGYGLITKGTDGKEPDFEYGLQDGINGQRRWTGVTTVEYDAGLLVTTEVTAAVDPGGGGVGLTKDLDTANATDTDIYTTPGPINELYETHVWDYEGDTSSPTDAVHEKGPKGAIREFTSSTYPSTRDKAYEAYISNTDPVTQYTGIADDYGFVPMGLAYGEQHFLGDEPQRHEPNTKKDEYPGASYNNGADYPGALRGPDQDYYEPTQSWQGYESQEQLWADFRQTLRAPFVSFGFNYGFNTRDTTMNEQNTIGPGALSLFGRVGTWWDVTQDTWVGNINGSGRCTSFEDPYCNGTIESPNDYAHNPTAAGDIGTPEWRGTCNADLTITLRPLTDKSNARDVDEDEDLERAWGTTNPPVGVYNDDDPLLADTTGDQNAGPVTITDDPDNETRSNHVQYGPITVSMGPDNGNCESGQWFTNEEVYFPSGSATYPIEVNATVDGLNENRDGRSGTVDVTTQTVRDVDVIHSWT